MNDVLSARNAVGIVFVLNGAAFATWVSRIPQTRQALGLDNAGLGLLLLAASVSSVVGLPTSGPLVTRFGASRVVRVGMVVSTVGLVLVTLGVTLWASAGATALGLAAWGLGVAQWDVAMNVEGATVEQRLGRTVMPRFHAGFSLGTVLAALVGALVIKLDVPMGVQLGAMVLIVLTFGVWSAGRFLPAEVEQGQPTSPAALRAWLEPRTLVVGLMVLAFALTEGSANDWLALALQDGYGAPRWLAVLGFAGFVSAMTLGRVAGPMLLDRFGRVRVLAATLVAALVGLGLTVFGGTPWLVVPGVLVWGLGASLGFPVGMSAAADDPARAAGRVAVVSTIGYTAFLAGPPLLGWLGAQVGTLSSLLAVAVVLVPAAFAITAAREQRPVGQS